MNIGISDKLLAPWMVGKEYITASDEGEAVGIAGGYYLATKKPATVFLSADGFCNALNPLTSWIIPEKIKINLVISYGRQEAQHYIMTGILEDLICLIKVYDISKAVRIELIEKKS